MQQIANDQFHPKITKPIKKRIQSSKQRYVVNLYGHNCSENLRSVLNLTEMNKDKVLVIFSSHIQQQNNIEFLLQKIFREALFENAILFFHIDFSVASASQKFLFVHCLKENLNLYKESIFVSTKKQWGFEEDWSSHVWLSYNVKNPNESTRQKIWQYFAKT